jgi:hypothetical protein
LPDQVKLNPNWINQQLPVFLQTTGYNLTILRCNIVAQFLVLVLQDYNEDGLELMLESLHLDLDNNQLPGLPCFGRHHWHFNFCIQDNTFEVNLQTVV